MADVRALLKAKREEIHVSHPLAAYSSAGQLRCTVCGTVVKHASAWEGHLGSKAHRTNVARLKEQERAKEVEQQQLLARGKRRIPEQDSDGDTEMADSGAPKRRRVGDEGGTNAFPADFFSDASRAPLPPVYDEDDPELATELTTAVPVQADDAVVDVEWQRFQAEVINAPDNEEIFEGATVFAEPEVAPEVFEGIPSAPPAEEKPMSKVDQDELRRRKELDERELIMDRLLDEERAQEEADMKVGVMKMRLEALKKKREAVRAAKSKPAA